jgi:hypothetical protein
VAVNSTGVGTRRSQAVTSNSTGAGTSSLISLILLQPLPRLRFDDCRSLMRWAMTPNRRKRLWRKFVRLSDLFLLIRRSSGCPLKGQYLNEIRQRKF